MTEISGGATELLAKAGRREWEDECEQARTRAPPLCLFSQFRPRSHPPPPQCRPPHAGAAVVRPGGARSKASSCPPALLQAPPPPRQVEEIMGGPELFFPGLAWHLVALLSITSEQLSQ